METAYIQFETSRSLTKRKDDNRLKRLIKRMVMYLLGRVIPAANPDFEEKIDHVKYWLIECDQISGIPQREIGLDPQGGAIVKMPHEKNYGYWTDNNLLLNDFRQHFKVTEITKEAFEGQWILIK